MESEPNAPSLCAQIAEEVREIATNLFLGRMSGPVFEKTVVALEAAKLQRHGFRLETEQLAGGGTRFRLVSARTECACATLEFNAATDRLEIHQIGG